MRGPEHRGLAPRPTLDAYPFGRRSAQRIAGLSTDFQQGSLGHSFSGAGTKGILHVRIARASIARKSTGVAPPGIPEFCES